MNQKKSGSRTLLLSVLMSAPGPLVVGLGLLVGKSSTQLADFFRRSAELLAIIVAFVVYQLAGKDPSPEKKSRLERGSNRFVGAVMCLSGAIMAALALFAPSEDKGNVIPGLAIALMGVIANCLFWRKYTRLSRETGSGILAVQGRLYRAKTLVDGCVTLALATVLLLPGSPAAATLDTLGSVVVALYLLWCGVKTLRESASAA